MIEFDRGIHLRGTSLWFDSVKKSKFSFISSADIGRFSPSEKVIATPETLRLIEKRIRDSVALACPYNRPFTIGSVEAELIPSGYMPGAAQIEIKTGGRAILYTGNISLRRSLTAEPIRVKGCPIVILKCTNSSPKYDFPEAKDVMESISGFIGEALRSGMAPVLLAENPGTAGELVKRLGEAGHEILVHRSISETLRMYEGFGIEIKGSEPFSPSKTEGRVTVFPLLRESKILDKIRDKKIGVVKDSAPDEYSGIKAV
ncbi:MAG TPA: hypothetical protein VHC46_03830, partial [Thermodesulfobacteriota bacterium]|nr:hypothetical protein [Thermodesulfobacteriota bacterium]